jgi:6-phosphogluconolactonase (cycloisomerase 2 family)
MWRKLVVAGLALVFAIGCDEGTTTPGNDPEPAVFAMTNASANAVVMHHRSPDGTLTQGRSFATQGTGTGANLGSQGALILSDDLRFLLAANAGSDDVTVFRLVADSLEFIQKIASGGDMPVSITHHGDRVYVLNAGGAGNITGFRMESDGRLTALALSRPLSGAASTMPAQVEFSNDGSLLVVTEKATNTIVTYNVDANGDAGQPSTRTSVGQTPFGFAFAPSGTLIVSEAFAPGGNALPNASAMSSYTVESAGNLAVISASVPTTETAACWVVVTGDGAFAYTSNTGSNSITGYSIGSGGTLTILTANGVTANSGGSMPVEMALSEDSEFLYVLNTGDGQVGAFRIGTDGSLTALGNTGGLPSNAYGLAAW